MTYINSKKIVPIISVCVLFAVSVFYEKQFFSISTLLYLFNFHVVFHVKASKKSLALISLLLVLFVVMEVIITEQWQQVMSLIILISFICTSILVSLNNRVLLIIAYVITVLYTTPTLATLIDGFDIMIIPSVGILFSIQVINVVLFDSVHSYVLENVQIRSKYTVLTIAAFILVFMILVLQNGLPSILINSIIVILIILTFIVHRSILVFFHKYSTSKN